MVDRGHDWPGHSDATPKGQDEAALDEAAIEEAVASAFGR
jgi:hypothetical protein